MSGLEETDGAQRAAMLDSLRAKLGQSSWWTEAIAGAGAGLLTYFLGHDLSPAMIAAIGAALILAIIRLKRRVIRIEAQASEAEQNFKLAATAFEETKFALTAVERRFNQRFEDALAHINARIDAEALARINADALARLSAVDADLQEAKAKLAEDIRRNGAEAAIRTTQKIDELQRETDDVRIGVRDAFRTGRIDSSFYRASSFDPEFDVAQVLAKQLKHKRAVDVGANSGEFTKCLRLAGFEVDVFEPLPELAAAISRHFAGDKKVRVHALACSDHEGTAPLHLAAANNRAINTTLFSSLTPHASFEGLSFDEKIDVPVARLDDILAPKRRLKIGLLKTDTEGHDLKVLAGASRIDAEALIVEFWDKSYVFNQDGSNNRLEDYLSFVDRSAYPYHVVMWRGDERNSFGFIFGALSTPASSWGNILFLKDKSVYDAVRDWAAVSFSSSFVDVDDGEPGLFEPIRGRQ